MSKQKQTIFDLPVFPAAAVFPLMSDAELAELAADIEANGLREPIVVAEVEADGKKQVMLVDGRNRRRACQLAGIEPEVAHLNGQDATAYVISANIRRRHMTAGQRAMAVAMIYPEPERGKRTDLKGTSVPTTEVASGTLSHARTVLKLNPAEAALVLAGGRPLSETYKQVCAERDAAKSEVEQLDELRRRYPELADAVVEQQLSLRAARVEADERDRKMAEERAAVVAVLVTAFKLASLTDEITGKVAGWFESDPEFKAMLVERFKATKDEVLAGQGNLAFIIEMVEADIPS